jgi:tryptophanyl-tRNA synthetase
VHDAATLRQNVLDVALDYFALGLDPEKTAFFRQSDVPEVCELSWILSTVAPMGLLEKAVSYKEKVDKGLDSSVGLFTYPVLMAADILAYRSHLVPVGKDQEQHLEMARTFTNRFNHRYGDYFPEPKAFGFAGELVKVPSLDGTGKMSKSENENATIYLNDSDEDIIRKVKKAKTDSGPTAPNMPKPDYIQNIFQLLNLVSAPDVVAKFDEDYNNCVIRYGDLKKQLGEDMAKFIAPIRAKAIDLQNDEATLQRMMKQGAEKARASASVTIQEVRKLIGVHYY